MLAQNLKTAAELRISGAEFDALFKVLGMLERGEIERGQFSMNSVRHSCGTPSCLCGWANYISRGEAFPLVDGSSRYGGRANWDAMPEQLLNLFSVIGSHNCQDKPTLAARHATTTQAAFALRSYLTTGEPNWAEALRP